MTHEHELVIVYTGTQISVGHLQLELEKAGIPCMLRDDFATGASAGYVVGTPTAVDVLIRKKDIEKANSIVQFFKDNIAY